MSKLMPVLGVFGTVPFICAFDKVFTFKDLARSRSVRWAKHDVIGQKPVLEWIGPELDRISLRLRFDTSLNVPPLLGVSTPERVSALWLKRRLNCRRWSDGLCSDCGEGCELSAVF